MRTSFIWATVVAGLLIVSSFAQRALTQQPANPGAQASRYGIAVVDISYIFKNHQRFKSMMDGMKEKVQAAEGALRTERQQIQQQEEELRRYQPGTPPYKALDEKITESKGDFNIRATKQRKEFLEQEAKIYYQAYTEVRDAVGYVAQRTNLGLVLRFNGEPIDPNKREDVLRAINKPVVYQGGIDITPDVLREVNRSQQGQPVNPQVGSTIPGGGPRR